ncbi:hypothetical protein EU805_07585 [Salipiger sp. IMCC34102]|uniref:hypothetical protein n=1 Tax=Salipiger sp. IMCC34102 TaxID=2510647 RepID=UPI00101D13C7|nr:hypothetical protein [Salipiger sp. IMCC34102]RYH03563.1 hypothetical protein EU805_07585 [Salipiger sp. IMCC34102]
MSGTKIATCCYCGTRAALVLRGETRHELACAQCGAPLHDLKMMPSGAGGTPARTASPAHPARTASPAHPARTLRATHQKPRKTKRKKGLGWYVMKGLSEVIDEVFD